MADERTKHVGCILTTAQHAAFKIACVKLGTTMGQVLEDAAREAIARSSGGEGERGRRCHIVRS